ncbi:hypothetical protein FRC00_009306 [Tulasnella sp. 408]|nr:hypothetical protein FRC00_009306 [Tulasnella sp. 408]
MSSALKDLPIAGAASAIHSPLLALAPELTAQIFTFADEGSFANAARSCTGLKEFALDRLWKEMPSLLPLLRLLDELTYTSNGWNFTNGLANADWDKFRSYAERVRGVTVVDRTDSLEVVISNSGPVATEASRQAQTVLYTTMAAFLESQKDLESLRLTPLHSGSPLKKSFVHLSLLRSLVITCVLEPRHGSLTEVLSSIASCTTLEQIFLRIEDPTSGDPLSFSDIRPLLGCRQLTLFDFSHLYALKLDHSDVVEMGKAWSQMESLSLWTDDFPFQLLSSFASSFSPRLRFLGLPLDLEDIESVDVLSRGGSVAKFPSLTTLHVGETWVKEDQLEAFAKALGLLCSPGVKIKSFERWRLLYQWYGSSSPDAVSIATKPPPAAMQEPSKKTLFSTHAEFGAAGRTPSQPPIFRLSTEILREIFSFLDQSGCSRVARSCKQFKEPALDQLWSKIATLVAPLALLDELVYSNNGWMFRNGLGQADWPNYWSYAGRVRGVHVTEQQRTRERSTEIDPHSLVHALAVSNSQFGCSALLPKVKTLEFDFQRPPGPVLLLQLISPAVRYITITIPGRFIQAASLVFSTLTSMSSSLNLECFDVTIQNDKSSAGKSGQDARTTLEANMTGFVATQLSLQTLRLQPIEPSSFKQAIGPLRRLRVLDVTCKTSTFQSPLRGMMASLGSCIDLEQLQIQGLLSHGRQNFSFIQPLLSCRRLTNLDLSWVGPITLDASNVEEMGNAWTKLESLQFSLAGDGLPVDLLPIFAASFSPSLRSLALPLDISTIERLSPVTKEIRSHDLKQLFTRSSIQESSIQPLAELLGTIFRSGFQIIHGSGTGDQKGNMMYPPSYNKVNSLLGLIWRVQDRTRQTLQNELGVV